MKLCVFVISVLFIASAFAVQSFPEELKETVYADLEAEKEKQAFAPAEEDENKFSDDIQMDMPEFDSKAKPEEEWGSSGFCHAVHHKGCSIFGLRHCRGRCIKSCSKSKFLRQLCTRMCIKRRCTCQRALDVYFHCQAHVCTKERVQCYKGCIAEHKESCNACRNDGKSAECKACRECWKKCLQQKGKE